MATKYFGSPGGVLEFWSIVKGDSLMQFQGISQVYVEGFQDVSVVQFPPLCQFEGEDWGPKLSNSCPDELFHSCH